MEICPRCQSTSIVRQLRPDTVHYMEVRCQECSYHQWLSKPKEKESKKRETEHCHLLNKYSDGYCEMCLRLEEELPFTQALRAHHVNEYHAGGTSDRSNIWILCTFCHQLVHCQRNNLGHYAQSKNLSILIAACNAEMKRTGFNWRSPRLLDYCEKLCGKRSRHFMREKHFIILLKKLQEQPTTIAEIGYDTKRV